MGVIAFQKPKEQESCDPHISGRAVCSACRHEWIAVAPIGSTLLDCPNCLTEKGRMKYACSPAEGAMIWQCPCGCDIYQVMDDGILCINCGLRQEF